METVRRELADIRSGIGWRLLALYRHVRLRAFPSGSRRNRTLRRVPLGGQCLRPHRRLSNGPHADPDATAAACRIVGGALGRLASEPPVSGVAPAASAHPGEPAGHPGRHRSVSAAAGREPPHAGVQHRAEVASAAIESVRQQLYPHWELCIVDDAIHGRTHPAVAGSGTGGEPRIDVDSACPSTRASRAPRTMPWRSRPANSSRRSTMTTCWRPMRCTRSSSASTPIPRSISCTRTTTSWARTAFAGIRSSSRTGRPICCCR